MFLKKGMMVMQEKLLLLHNFLKEIKQVVDEEELIKLSESYKEKIGISSDNDVMNKLIHDAKSLGKEIIYLRSNGTEISRRKKLAALSAEERAELAEVEAIIDENRFAYHFQPIVSTSDGSIYSYEALMRPQSDMGLSPFHVLKYAELTGRLSDIERATFLNVLNIIDSNKEVFKDRRVFINSIPRIRLDGSDFRRVGELLIKHSDTAVVELTEYAETEEDELNMLKERYMNMGVKIAIDDYGTGYSNVKNLLRYMPNYVKIDRTLITDIQTSPKKRHFVREIIEFCHSTNIMALAEGVETAEELRAVILLGADLIQGYYTAKPGAEIIDSIPDNIIHEIKTYQLARQDGKDQQVYTVQPGERVQLDRLIKDDYKCILAGKNDADDSEITIVGSPSLDTEIHIETAKGFKGKIVLENAHLSNIKERPCIELGENSDVTLILKGESKLENGGILVPKSAKFTLDGSGIININLNAAEYFGIGNDVSSSHGDLIFNHSGVINIIARGREGVCIGSGLGGNIFVNQGKFIFNLNGRTGVGIGTLYGDSQLNMNNFSLDADIAFLKGVAVGSLTGSAEVHIRKSSTKLYMCGEELVAVGTISGEKSDISLGDAIMTLNLRSPNCTCIGSLEENTYFKVENAAFRAEVGGPNALPFGSINGDTKVSFVGADVSVLMDTGADLEHYLSPGCVEIVGGRTSFSNHGNEIKLNATE